MFPPYRIPPDSQSQKKAKDFKSWTWSGKTSNDPEAKTVKKTNWKVVQILKLKINI